MFTANLRQDDHIRHYSISAAKPSGWEVRLEEDQTVRRLDHYQDWHRVERTLTQFQREVNELTENGWNREE